VKSDTTTRSPRDRGRTGAWLAAIAVVAIFVVVVVAKFLRGLPAVQSFMADYPGASALPAGAPVGFPAWLAWQHLLNSFFVLFIIRTGWQIRGKKRPPAFWSRRNEGAIRTTQRPVRIGLNTWFHLVLDILWVLNGVVFYILLFTTDQWARIIPVHWDVFPNAVSTAIQYASLGWPTNDGWANYNALQLLTYFVTVFVAAPLALVTGIRITPGLAYRLRSLDRVFSLRVARSIHAIVMIYFVAFVIVHVTLVLATNTLRNVNHMYAGRDDQSWIGFVLFAASVVLMAVLWVFARPALLGRLAALTGNVRR
jgi:thiosulfate reductase cytochrome b subunit